MQSNNGLSELIVEQKEGRISRISASSSLIVSRAFSDKMSRTATFLLALLASAAHAAPLIEGLVAPTFTPLGANGTSFDAAAVDGLARWAGNGTGVHWVYLTGSTGESVDLTTAERKATVEAWAVAAPRHGLRVVVHVGSDSVATARDLAAHAAAHGADAGANCARDVSRTAHSPHGSTVEPCVRLCIVCVHSMYTCSHRVTQ